MPSTSPWLVFADDWGRHPSSCQHLIRHLLPRRQMTWVNTIGTRLPRLDLSTAKRVVQKLGHWIRPVKSVANVETPGALSPRIISPKMWPSFRSKLARKLNRKLLLKALKPVVEAMPEKPVVVTTLPLVADLIGELPVAGWVYYCVDDFSVWPGYDGETMGRMERDLLPGCGSIITVSETLRSKLSALGYQSHVLTHGVDLDHWQLKPGHEVPELRGHLGPFVVFWGVLDRRMDLQYLRALAEKLRAGTIVLVGPQEDPDPELFHLPRTVILPSWPYSRLPELASASSVLIMPYADIPATRAMQPLKLKEYLATGRPAVVRRLPSTEAWGDCVDLASSPEEFSELVLRRIESGLPSEQASARNRLTLESWVTKSKQFEVWVNAAAELSQDLKRDL